MGPVKKTCPFYEIAGQSLFLFEKDPGNPLGTRHKKLGDHPLTTCPEDSGSGSDLHNRTTPVSDIKQIVQKKTTLQAKRGRVTSSKYFKHVEFGSYCTQAIMFSPEDSIEECKEAFYLYDRRGDKKVECNQIGEVMRALGTNPTEGEIGKIIRSLDPAGTGTKRVSFEEFFPIYQNLRDRQKKSGGKVSLVYYIYIFCVY